MEKEVDISIPLFSPIRLSIADFNISKISEVWQ